MSTFEVLVITYTAYEVEAESAFDAEGLVASNLDAGEPMEMVESFTEYTTEESKRT